MHNFIVLGTVPDQTVTPSNKITKEQVLCICFNLYKYLNHVVLLGTGERGESVAQLNTLSGYTVCVCIKEIYSTTAAVKLEQIHVGQQKQYLFHFKNHLTNYR